MPEVHKTTEYEFGNKNLLLKTINTQLMVIKLEITNPDIHNRLFLLVNSIHRCASQYFLFGKTYAFGSRMSGLALKESDVDLYFDIGNVNSLYFRLIPSGKKIFLFLTFLLQKLLRLRTFTKLF